LLYKDLGYSPTGEDFPLMDKRFGLKSMTGNDAKIYNEWLLRVREILDSTEYQRLKEIENNQMEQLKDFEKWKEWKNEPQ
jgi:hypothetical protein